MSPGSNHKPYAIRPKPYAIPAGSRMAYGLWCMASLLLVAAVAPVSEAATRIALLPFQNVSGHIRSPAIITPLIEPTLRTRGYEVVTSDAVEAFLIQHRIRATNKLSREQLAALGKEFGAEFAMVGSIDLFADTPGNPQWGLSARLLETASGSIVWADAAGVTGDDFTGFLGLGTVTSPEELAVRVVEMLFRSLPTGENPGEEQKVARAPRSVKLPGRVFRDPRLDTGPPKSVAVLPFENGTDRRGAALIMDDLMVAGLFKASHFEVADAGEVQHVLQTRGLAPYGAIDVESLRQIGEGARVDAVILGRVDDYNEGLRPGTSTSPSIALDARMLDAKTGQILWMGSHEARGEESQIVLEFGKIKSMVPLAMRVISEMVGTMQPSPRLPGISSTPYEGSDR